jgi:uncharacterized protein (TIGR02246 family)
MKTSILAAAAALVATPALAATCPTVSAADVESQFNAFNAAWATKDPDKVVKLFSKEPVLLATVSNKLRDDTAEVRDYFVSFLKNSPVGKIDTSKVRIDCNTASRVGHWTVTLTDPNTGAKTDVKARYSFIYTYEDGAWKIAHLHSSVLPPS